jgi:pyruvate dehydrogenase E2 component (dihydrolipoyllysine-residue acetyltransferase)
MPVDVFLMKVGMTMTDGRIGSWYVSDGDLVNEGDLLYLLETEKVSMDIESPATGTIRHLFGAGATVPAATVIGYIYGTGEIVPASVLPTASPVPTDKHTTPVAGDSDQEAAEPLVDAAADASVASQAPASPLARRIAKELGVDLAGLHGSGPGGRITEHDVRKRAEEGMSNDNEPRRASGPANDAPEPKKAAQPMSGMRRQIADHMLRSLQTTAQLTLNMDVSMDEAVRLRGHLIADWEAEGIRPTFTDMVVKAAGLALRKHPYMNAEVRDGELALLPEVHVGLAVALDEGLVVVSIRNPDVVGLREIASESRRLAQAARSRRLSLDETKGASFTVTSLGPFGVESFTPVLNLPQVGILGINAIRDAVGWHGDQPVRRQLMTLSLTWDHQAVDGVPAAQFLGTVRELLQAPYRLLVP